MSNWAAQNNRLQLAKLAWSSAPSEEASGTKNWTSFAVVPLRSVSLDISYPRETQRVTLQFNVAAPGVMLSAVLLQTLKLTLLAVRYL